MNKSEIRLFQKNRENQAGGFSVSCCRSATGMAMQKKAARRRGSAVVETALVFGVLSLLIFGGLDFAIQFHVRYLMSSAARDAARYLAVQNGTQAQATTAAQARLSSINATFTVTFPTPASNTDVTVQISVPRKTVSLGLFPGSPGATITVKSTMRKEV
ncbi:MAG: TadE family protein [Sedimentisphaerales bacterium]|jgi:Flp pilus assembly protein TadG